MSFKNILLEKDGPIYTLTLNRPERMNAISIETVPELIQALSQVGDDADARVLVITGAGDRAFSAGADVADMVRRSAPEAAAIVRMYLDYIMAIRNLAVPVIAKVNGVAAGGGCCTAIACDLRVASEQARFGFVFVNAGLTAADMGATYFLPRLVGFGRACELLLTGAVIDAQEAERIGLVNRVVPHDELDAATDELSRKLAAGPPIALRLTKEALHGGLDKDIASEFQFETYAQTLCLVSEDHLEGAQAFREKRAPVFQGR
ncbi:MAG: hypothetical protein A2148_09515 [Chloroflexi bacterium RBG_16_68_14]|nr:MAG: hypothetical protein A2148_09515 [Chloroflexi bacterium RBG_16_68_14]